jgi:hypothetical protein
MIWCKVDDGVATMFEHFGVMRQSFHDGGWDGGASSSGALTESRRSASTLRPEFSSSRSVLTRLSLSLAVERRFPPGSLEGIGGYAKMRNTFCCHLRSNVASDQHCFCSCFDE